MTLLAIANCLSRYLGHYVNCALLKSKETCKQEKMEYVNSILETTSPMEEPAHDPITARDAAAGLQYILVLLKSQLSLKPENAKTIYLKFGSKTKKSSWTEIDSDPVYYVLYDVLNRCGYRIVEMEAFQYTSKDVYCKIVPIDANASA